jgi:Ca2+-binding RTX toxin-like protein
VTSITAARGGDDRIITGDGEAWVIGGEGADRITDGNGKAVLLGDLGTITANAKGLIRIQTTFERIGGADIITKRNGPAFVFGGAAGDKITMAAGDHTVSGDMGVLDFVNGVRRELRVAIDTPAWGGDDTISAGVGSNWMIGGEGNDVISNVGGESVIIGDAGTITADAAGRVKEIYALQPQHGGNDRIYGGIDRDIAFGGAGDDYLDGGAGDDMLAGETGHFTRELLANGATLFTFEQSGDFEYGGDDTLIGGAGRDLMIGGTGHDFFQVDYTDDFASGEFGRFRLLGSVNGEEHLISVLTLASRDLDLIGNVGERLFYKTPRTNGALELGGTIGLTLQEMMRVDVLVLQDDGLDGTGLSSGMFAGTSVEGLRSFRLLSEPDLLTTANLLISQDNLADTDLIVEEQASLGGWKFEGWTMSGQG